MWLLRLFRRSRWDDERRRELESYIEIETDENIARGLDPLEARARAHRQLGNVTLVREEIYRMNSITWLESFWFDVRFAARSLRKSPAFTAVALLSLALGIGANAALFQLLDIVRLRGLPISRPDEIVEVRIPPGTSITGQTMGPRPMLTNAIWERLRDRQTSLQPMFAYGAAGFETAAGGESRVVPGLFVSGQYFEGLEGRAVAGRLLGPADDVRGCAPAGAVVSHGYWQRELGSASDLSARTIRLDGVTVPVIGVVDARFSGVDVGRRVDVYLPICSRPVFKKANPALDRLDVWWLAAFGRLKPGVSVEQASAESASVSAGIFQETVPPNYDAGTAKSYVANRLIAVSAARGVASLGRQYATSLTILLSIAGLVFLIACANLANLMLARASARSREMAVRLAIGASRPRLFRQLIAESLLLATTGAVAGLAIAMVLSRVLVSILTSDGSFWALDLSMDWRLAAFAVGLAFVACLLFGLAPAIRSTRVYPGAVMHLGGRGLTADRQRLMVRRALVVGQIGISLVLVVGALLFVGTLRNLGTADLGFEDRQVLVVDLDLRPAGVPADQLVPYSAALATTLAGVPGVSSAGLMDITPLSGSGWNEAIVVNGERQDTYPDANRVSPEWFAAMSVPFVSGRNFDATDRAGAPPVVIVNEAFRDRYFGAGNPLGRQFKIVVGPKAPDPFYEVIGVVKNTKYRNLREAAPPQMFFAAAQATDPGPFATVAVRAEGDPAALRAGIAAAAARVHPAIVLQFTNMREQIDNTLLRERLMATLSAGFALLAVSLAAVGLYGLMAYGVARRRNEIGIRVALGATRSRIVRMIFGETAWLVAIGVALGVVGARFAVRSAEALFFGLTGSDPRILAVAAIALAGIAMIASAIPASRAARLNPTTAIREEA